MLQQELVHFPVFWFGTKGDFRHLQLGAGPPLVQPHPERLFEKHSQLCPVFLYDKHSLAKNGKEGTAEEGGLLTAWLCPDYRPGLCFYLYAYGIFFSIPGFSPPRKA